MLDLFDEVALIVLVIIAALVLLVFFVLPALIFVLQLLIFLALTAFTLFVRILLRRPWTVEAVRLGPDPKRMEWAVVGWWRTRRVISEVAQGLSLGHRYIHPEGARWLPAPLEDSPP